MKIELEALIGFAVVCFLVGDRSEGAVVPVRPRNNAVIPVSPPARFQWRGDGKSVQLLFSTSKRFPSSSTLRLPDDGVAGSEWEPDSEAWADILRLAAVGGGDLYWRVEELGGVGGADEKVAAGKARKNSRHLQFQKYTAVMSTRSATFDAGSLASASTVAPWSSNANLVSTVYSDHVVVSHAGAVYEILRYNLDSVIKYRATDIGPKGVVYQYSTKDAPGAATSNPYDLGFVSDTKAYLTRYESAKLWVVNPSASSQAGFKVGEIDLSSLADEDGIPEMSSVIVLPERNLAFVACQRLNRNAGWVPVQPGYLAVIDTKTDKLIKIGQAPGIELVGTNPAASGSALLYSPELDRVFVVCSGKLPGWDGSPAKYNGGIEVVNPSGLVSEGLLVDDGPEASPSLGGNFFGGLAIFSPSLGAFVVYAGWGDNRVLTFNPTTGEVYGTLGDLNGRGIDMIAGDPFCNLWVSDADSSTMRVYNPKTGSRIAELRTGLIANSITFVGPIGKRGGTGQR